MVRLLNGFLVICILSGCQKETGTAVFMPFTWPVSDPVAQGLDTQFLDSAVNSCLQLGYVDGLVVVRNGYLVMEQYFNGYNAHIPHAVMSVSKSFLSAITGIALDKGLLNSLDDIMLDYFPEYVYSGMDARKFDINLHHLMTMRMGIDKEENNLFDVLATENWLKSTIELPLLNDPGETFCYNTLETHLLSAILQKSSRMSTLELTEHYLTSPMGITIDWWTQDPQGYYFGGSEMFFTPREMAVLGYLYMNEGRIRGTQIVPAEWVVFTLTPTWMQNSPQWGVLTEYNYGYLWWLGKIGGIPMFMALGHGGQTVLTFPDLNLIIVTTAEENVGWDADQTRPILDVVSRYILKSIIDIR